MSFKLRQQNKATSVPQGSVGNVGTLARSLGTGFLGIAGGIVADRAISSVKRTNKRVKRLKAKDRARAHAVKGTGRK